MALPAACLANPAKYFTDSARAAAARGDLTLAAAVNALPFAVVSDPVTYLALAGPVTDAIESAAAVDKA